MLTGIVAWLLGLITVRLSGHYLPLGTRRLGDQLLLPVRHDRATSSASSTAWRKSRTCPLFGHRLADPHGWLYLIWAVLLGALWLAHNLLDSRHGRVIRALNGGRLMAESMGIDTDAPAAAVFVLAALYAGLSGWLFAHYQRFVNPTPFSLTRGHRISVHGDRRRRRAGCGARCSAPAW